MPHIDTIDAPRQRMLRDADGIAQAPSKKIPSGVEILRRRVILLYSRRLDLTVASTLSPKSQSQRSNRCLANDQCVLLLCRKQQCSGDMITAALVSNGYNIVAGTAHTGAGGVVGPGEDRLHRGGIKCLAIAGEGNPMGEIGITHDIDLV